MSAGNVNVCNISPSTLSNIQGWNRMSFSSLPSHDMSWFNWADCSDHPIRAKICHKNTAFNEPHNATQSAINRLYITTVEKYPKLCGTLYPLSPHLYPSWCRGTASRLHGKYQAWKSCRWPWFENYVHPISTSRLCLSSMLAPRRTMRWSIVGVLPFLQHPSHNFCAIVAFCRRGEGSRHVPIGDFCEFQ